MIAFTVVELASIMDAQIVDLDPNEIITHYPEIDSRNVVSESFFVALPGTRVDGNAYAREAINNGARFALTTQNLGIPSLVVKDTSTALTRLATVAREQMTQCVFIAITGSHGKTTTKDLLGHILPIKGETVAPVDVFFYFLY